jgi:Flp pilus assembly protein TadD
MRVGHAATVAVMLTTGENPGRSYQCTAEAASLHRQGLRTLLAGAPAAALPALQRAVELAPTQPVYYNNLAEASRRAGDSHGALAALESALELDPLYTSARRNRAVVLFESGHFKEALADFACALESDPHDASLIAFRADCLRELGQLRAAKRIYLRALRRDPDLVHAHSNLGPLLGLLGEHQAALRHCERAVALAGSGAAWMNLAHCRLELEQPDAAMEAYATAFERDPQSAPLCCSIAQAWQQVGDFEQAALWLERARERAPDSLRLQACLAELLLDTGHSEQALEVYRELSAKVPHDADVALGHGRALWDEGDVAGALDNYRRAAALRPRMAQIHTQIANVLASSGDLAGAESAHRVALAIAPRCIAAIAGLATLLRSDLPTADVRRAQALLAGPGLRDGARSSLHAGLAHHFDGLGDFARASEHAAQGNGLYWKHCVRRGWNYDPAEHAEQIDRIIATFTPALFARLRAAGNPDERPSFVVGMPRSGTTLTEQILAGHRSILGVGERPFAARSLQRIPAVTGACTPALAALSQLDAQGLRGIAAEYAGALDAQAQKSGADHPSILRIVDKMPDNCELLGWIALLFPRARLIYVRRDPRDIALSCWMQRFGQIRWACDMQHIAERLVQHHRLMAHWRRVLPVPLFEFDYEALVADVEKQARALIDFMGLPWDSACLDYARGDRVVRTASVVQVRKPIYNTSIARWRNYRTALAPVLRHFPQ